MQEFNSNLISAISERIPKKGEQLNFLMNTSSMGKETAYRRLRGDIPFTFSEACTVAKALGISLDNIAKVNRLDKPVFELEISPDDTNNYIQYKLEQYEQSYSFFTNSPITQIETVCNIIPYAFLFPYENLFRIHSFRLLYQTDTKRNAIKFAERQLPDDLNEKRIELAKLNHCMPENTIIFDRHIFISFMKHIRYYYSMDLVDDDEMEILKREFLALIDDFENIAIAGKRCDGEGEGCKSWIYLSNIDFDCNYSYVIGENFERAYMDGIYLMDTISSSDPQICRLHKEWIESLKKYSTLISVSGEMERRAFFDAQRQLVVEVLEKKMERTGYESLFFREREAKSMFRAEQTR